MAERPWLIVAAREFQERVRTRWFVAVTLLGPVAMAALLVVPVYLASQADGTRVDIDVVDQSGHDLLPALRAAAAETAPQVTLHAAAADLPLDELQRRIRAQERSGYLVVPAGVLGGAVATYRGDNASNLHLRAGLAQAVNQAAIRARARAAAVDDTLLGQLLTPRVPLEVIRDNGTGPGASADATFVVGYVAMFLLYMSIMLYGANVMRSVVIEKTSRVVEVLVAAVKPRELMLGKVLGVGAVGLVQMGLWVLVGLLLVHFRGDLLGAFGVAVPVDDALPPLGLGDALVVLAYFGLGYFFYAALYAALGAMVSSDQEAQQAQTPVVLLLILPVLVVQVVVNDPRGAVAELLTLLPFSSPVLMPMRWLLGGATLGELLLSLGILAASLYAVVVLAGRIYRVGLLMYGKRPSLRELGRWLRRG